MKELVEEFRTFHIHADPVSYFMTEDGIYMAVLQQEILKNAYPVGQDFPTL